MIAALVFSILVLIFLILKVKMHASIALFITSILVGVLTNMSLTDLVSAMEKGLGGLLAFLVPIMGFGVILGKMLEDSGGADRLASTVLNKMGNHRASWVMMIIGFTIGIPLFSDVGFLLLVPLVAAMAKKGNMPRLQIGIPLMLSLQIIHCLIPPHPAATAVSTLLGADIGITILCGILVGLPCAVAGTMFINFLCKYRLVDAAIKVEEDLDQDVIDEKEKRELPAFGITLFTIMLPLLIMVAKTVLEAILPEGHSLLPLISFLGNPMIALLIAIIFAFWSLGLARGRSLNDLGQLTDSAYSQIAGIMLILAAGGALNGVIIASGVGESLSSVLYSLPISPIILAWLLAGILHFSIGSATVAMISTAGIIHPMIQTHPELNPVVMTLAIGCGVIGFVQFTSPMLWYVKEYLNITLSDTIKGLSGGFMLASVLGLCLTLLISTVI